MRTTASGKARFLFNSLSERGVVYSVDPQSLSCTCPAAHRYGGVCKHGICAYILQRVAQRLSAGYQVGEAS